MVLRSRKYEVAPHHLPLRKLLSGLQASGSEGWAFFFLSKLIPEFQALARPPLLQRKGIGVQVEKATTPFSRTAQLSPPIPTCPPALAEGGAHIVPCSMQFKHISLILHSQKGLLGKDASQTGSVSTSFVQCHQLSSGYFHLGVLHLEGFQVRGIAVES